MRRISLAWSSMSAAWPGAAPPGLVEQDAGVRQGEALALRARRQQHRRRRRRLPEADRGDVGLDVLHRVVDREQRGDVAARRVDVDVDVLVGVLRLEVQQLGAHQVGDRVVDRRAQEDDVLLEQPRVEVVRPLAPVGLLDDRRDEVVATRARSLGLPASSGRSSSSCSSARRVGSSSAPGRSASRRSSTTSTCSTSQSSALRFLRSERTAGHCSLRSNSLRTLAGCLLDALGQPVELGVEVVVGDLDALGLGDGPQGEVGLDRLRRQLPQLGDELLLGLAAWPRGTARPSMPCAEQAHGEVLEALLHLGRRPAPRAASSSTSSTSAWATLRRAARSGPGPGGPCAMRLAMSARSSSTVSNSETSLAHSSSTSGSTFSLTSLTSTRKLDRRPRSGSGCCGVELEDVADLRPAQAARRARGRSCRCRPRRGSRRR